MSSSSLLLVALVFVGLLGLVQSEDEVSLPEKLVHPPKFPSRLADWLKNFECLFCKEFLTNLYLGVEEKISPEQLELIKEFATQVCLNTGQFDMGYTVDIAVCRGMVEEFTPDMYYIVFQSKLSPHSVCHLIDVCPPEPGQTWNVTFSDTPKPPVQPPQNLNPNGKRYRVMHISDLHYDPDYSPGSNAVCDEPTCCRAQNGKGEGDNAAGYWGDYRNCDPPKWTFENLLQNAVKEYNDTIDFIVYSGDTPAHIDWATSPLINSELMNSTYNMIRDYFPNTPYYGTLGNHESSPLNTFPGDQAYLGAKDECSMQWLYDNAAACWAQDLDEDAQNRLRNGGFYSQRVEGFDDLIIVSLNMNFGDSENWWLLVDSVDPYGMLQWLSDTLALAESNGDKVMIVGHQASAHEVPIFRDVYFDLAYRYESTILGHFMGHSHEDEFYVYLDPYNISRGFSSLFVTGSVTTYSDLNVMYRVYEYDLDTHQLAEVYNHIFNMTEANINGPDVQPNWYMEYNPVTAYGFNGSSGITFQDWADLTVEFETNDDLWNEYQLYKGKSARGTGDCTGSCQTSGICNMRTTSGQADFCANMNSPVSQQELRRWRAAQTKLC